MTMGEVNTNRLNNDFILGYADKVKKTGTTNPGASLPEVSLNEEIKDVLVKKTDKSNDGKFSWMEAARNFGKGLISPITAMFSSVTNFAIGAGIIAAGVGLIMLVPAAAIPLMALGLAAGAVTTGVGIYKAATAKNGDDVEKAFYQFGQATFEIVGSLIGAKSLLKGSVIKNTDGVKSIKDAELARSITGLDDVSKVARVEQVINEMGILDQVNACFTALVPAVKSSWNSLTGRTAGGAAAGTTTVAASQTDATPAPQPNANPKPAASNIETVKPATSKLSFTDDLLKLVNEKNIPVEQRRAILSKAYSDACESLGIPEHLRAKFSVYEGKDFDNFPGRGGYDSTSHEIKLYYDINKSNKGDYGFINLMDDMATLFHETFHSQRGMSRQLYLTKDERWDIVSKNAIDWFINNNNCHSELLRIDDIIPPPDGFTGSEAKLAFFRYLQEKRTDLKEFPQIYELAGNGNPDAAAKLAEFRTGITDAIRGPIESTPNQSVLDIEQMSQSLLKEVYEFSKELQKGSAKTITDYKKPHNSLRISKDMGDGINLGLDSDSISPNNYIARNRYSSSFEEMGANRFAAKMVRQTVNSVLSQKDSSLPDITVSNLLKIMEENERIIKAINLIKQSHKLIKRLKESDSADSARDLGSIRVDLLRNVGEIAEIRRKGIADSNVRDSIKYFMKNHSKVISQAMRDL